MVSTRASKTATLPGLQDGTPRPETNSKRPRDESDDVGLWPVAKRPSLFTPTPKKRSSEDPNLPNGSRGWQTDPGRKRLGTPRQFPRTGLKNSTFYQSSHAHVSAQGRLARLNAGGRLSDFEMAEDGKQSGIEPGEEATITKQRQPQAEQQHSAGSQAPLKTQTRSQPVIATPSRTPQSGFFKKAFQLIASPAAQIFQRSISQHTGSGNQPQSSSPPTAQDPSPPAEEDEYDESTPRLGRSIFSDKPSAYHTPAHELEKLEKRRLPLARLTDKEVAEQMAREAHEIETRNRELGYAAPTSEAVDEDDLPEPPPSTGQKRKLSTIDGMLPGPRAGGFGISDEYLDQDNDIEGIGESLIETDTGSETPVPKRQKLTAMQTPRSALKKAANTNGLGSTRKKVFFNTNPVASVRGLTPNYGRTGHYNGSTFSDVPRTFDGDSTSSLINESKSSSSSTLSGPILSPTTFMHTLNNERVDRTLNPSTRDPADPDWRPSPANPRPGQFCLPDFEDEEDEMSGIQEESTIVTTPASPRPAHAELPSPSATPMPSFNESSILFESSELALNKARSQAEKYKPKDSSRLSQVEQARSRSSSPPLQTAEAVEAASGTNSAQSDANKENDDPSPDDPNRDARGMNLYDRMHEHDEWAQNLPWPEPVTRAEAGLCSQRMQDYVADNWTEEDSRQSRSFWFAEFDRIEAIFADAERRGLEVEFVND